MKAKQVEKATDIHCEIKCNLKELYNGCLKTIEYKRVRLSLDAKHLEEETVTKNIEIKPGFKNNHQLVFKNQGNQDFERKMTWSSDLIVTIKQTMGEELKRAGDHLVYTHRIDLADALNAVPIKFTSLDGRTLVKSVDCIISPQTVLEI